MRAYLERARQHGEFVHVSYWVLADRVRISIVKFLLWVHISKAPGNWAINFIMVASDVFNIISAVLPPHRIYKIVCQFTCFEQSLITVRFTNRSKILSSIWNLLFVILLAHRIWRCFIDFWEMCGHLVYVACSCIFYLCIFGLRLSLRWTVLTLQRGVTGTARIQ